MPYVINAASNSAIVHITICLLRWNALVFVDNFIILSFKKK